MQLSRWYGCRTRRRSDEEKAIINYNPYLPCWYLAENQAEVGRRAATVREEGKVKQEEMYISYSKLIFLYIWRMTFVYIIIHFMKFHILIFFFFFIHFSFAELHFFLLLLSMLMYTKTRKLRTFILTELTSSRIHAAMQEEIGDVLFWLRNRIGTRIQNRIIKYFFIFMIASFN